MNKKILIIEDDTLLSTTLIEAFKNASFEVFSAKDGELGIEEAKKICYLMDRDTAIKFIADYSATGWIYKRQKITDWRALLPAWKVNEYNFKTQKGGSQRGNYKHVSTNPADFDESKDGRDF